MEEKRDSVDPCTDPTADDQLARLGYQAELPRQLSMFSVMGLSFAIMVRTWNDLYTRLYHLASARPLQPRLQMESLLLSCGDGSL